MGELIGSVEGESSEDAARRLRAFVYVSEETGQIHQPGFRDPYAGDEQGPAPGEREVLADAEAAADGKLDGDEDESVDVSVAMGEAQRGQDVITDLAVSAASLGKGLDGPTLAAFLEGQGAITDVRLTVAVEVLRLGQKVTGERVLGVLTALGFEDEVHGARVLGEELGKAGGVVVESSSALPVVPEGAAT